MARLLLHACCGPCATYTVDYWLERGFQVTALWYNPNIHPFQEHQARLRAMRALSEIKKVPLIVLPGYDMVSYLRAVVGKEGMRCQYCYRLRLEKAAQVAREQGFDAFTTTLFISPYQNQELLRQVGEELGAGCGVRFLGDDLRSGFRESRQVSRQLGLYLQQYCGCLYSEWERHGRLTIPPLP